MTVVGAMRKKIYTGFGKRDNALEDSSHMQLSFTRRKLDDWSKRKENYGIAISNPSFEFWLLLHYHDTCTKNTTASACTRELSTLITGYKDCKRILPKQFTGEQIKEAIRSLYLIQNCQDITKIANNKIGICLHSFAESRFVLNQMF